MSDRELIYLAHRAREKAYVPYSGFSVGAALLTKGGRVFLRCNVENAPYGASNCAERTAFFKAVSEGERDFAKIAIVGGPRETETCEAYFPCGICRQMMSEFCDSDQFMVLLEEENGTVKRFALRELLPQAFEM